jgi:sigma-B regulation protein RsbU (phosphoserine phosphatase)
MDTGKPRLLLVDDDSAVLRSFVRALHDYAPLHADDGLAAQKILSETPVDIVLCDLEMPRMNGLDLMRWAKKHCPRPLWIVVTGGGTFDAAKQALKLGAFDFVCKPILSPIQLQNVVANAERHQALATERNLLMRSLADNSLRLAQANRKLEATVAVLSEQQGMLDQDLRRAERILQALLPRTLPRIPRMQVNVAYLPSKSIGGDFYGAAMVDDRHLAVYVADVAGHGVSAALLAVLFNQRLGMFEAEGGRRAPAALLGELNRALLEECRASGLFVTAVYALIDTEERTATIASAGHPPGILLSSDGTSQHLEKTGPALGLASDSTYEEHRISLAEGDRLLLYTDGLTGALSERAPSLDTIFSASASGAGDGARVIEQLLTSTARDEQADDDMTLLLLTASAGASTFESDQAAAPRVAPADCPLSIGSAEGTTWVLVRGRATWKDAAMLRDTCIEALDGGQSVVVDLASCAMLDSTMLGTLHELVVRAGPRQSTSVPLADEKVMLDGNVLGAMHERDTPPRASLHLQSVGPDILALFAELAMTQVLSSIAPCAQTVPADMVELHAKGVVAAQDLILHAHELLAELSASNATQFQPVVDALRAESLH